MPCFHPIDVLVNKRKIIYEWIALPNGKLKKGKPVSVADKYVVQVPCGKCPACLALQQSQWSFRIEQEALNGGHASTLFVTFTYDNEHLPEDYGLHKEEMQKYLHDLRQNISRRYFDGTHKESLPKCRYYICGEYGSRFGRPHFHAILFFSKPIDWLLIQDSWGKGIVDIRPFTSARAGYVAKYSVKQLELNYEGRPRPFHMQSQGLGKCFLNGRNFDTLQYDTYFANLSGKRVKLPRYYLDKIGSFRRVYKIKHTDGSFSTRSFTSHSIAYERLNELSFRRYLQKEADTMFLNNWTSTDFYRFNRERMNHLEINLLERQKQSYYYAKSASESRLVRESV